MIDDVSVWTECSGGARSDANHRLTDKTLLFACELEGLGSCVL
jgi:hypothetical protein